MGRHTFDFVVDYGGPWPYGDKRIVVLSSRPVDLSTAIGRGGKVEQMGGEPADVMARLAATGARHLYVDGGITIQRFLRAGVITRLIVTRVTNGADCPACVPPLSAETLNWLCSGVPWICSPPAKVESSPSWARRIGQKPVAPRTAPKRR